MKVDLQQRDTSGIKRYSCLAVLACMMQTFGLLTWRLYSNRLFLAQPTATHQCLLTVTTFVVAWASKPSPVGSSPSFTEPGAISLPFCFLEACVHRERGVSGWVNGGLEGRTVWSVQQELCTRCKFLPFFTADTSLPHLYPTNIHHSIACAVDTPPRDFHC